MKVSDVLQQKERMLHTVTEDKSIAEAVSLLIRYRIGALLVCNEEEEIRGILSERDIMRHLDRSGGVLGKYSVRELMTPKSKLIVAAEDDDLDYVMRIMTENRVRHLPIIHENGQLIGLISIGDVIKCQLSSEQYENKMLQNYITGYYPG